MLCTYPSLSMPSTWCESGNPLEADSTMKSYIGGPIIHAPAGPQLSHVSPLAGKYRPGSSSAFVRGAVHHTQTRLKSMVAEDRENCHQMMWQRFGNKPLTADALRTLTDNSAAHGVPDRRNLASRAGIGNATYLSMTKGGRALQTKMRRTLQPAHFGPGTGFKTWENTMPWRDVLRDVDRRREVEATGCLRGVPVLPGPPPASPLPQPPSAPDALESSDMITGVGLGPCGGSRTYTFQRGTWRPSTSAGPPLGSSRGNAAKRAGGRSGGSDGSVRASAGADDARPSTAPEAHAGGAVSARRPMTPAGSSPIATALRQLEGDHRKQSGYFRPGTGSRDPMAYKGIVPSRGNMLAVFNAMDDDLNGKVTYTEFLDSMVDIGCTEAQASDIFNRLDVGKSGYIELQEWGTTDPACLGAIEKLTLAYMRRHMGFPSQVSSADKVERYSKLYRAKEVTSMTQALSLARDYCFQKGAAASADGESPMILAFRFMDVDKSGQLDRQELMDGFAAIGVTLHPQLMDQLWNKFDMNQSSHIDYGEFVSTLMPRGR